MTRNIDGRIPADDIIPEIKSLIKKTGWGLTALFRYGEREGLLKRTKSFSPEALNCVLYSQTKTIIEDDYIKLIEAYKSITPDMYGKQHALSRRKARIPITEEFKARLEKMLSESSMSRAHLLKNYGAPTELTNAKLGLILKRENSTIMRTHADFLERLIQARNCKK